MPRQARHQHELPLRPLVCEHASSVPAQINLFLIARWKTRPRLRRVRDGARQRPAALKPGPDVLYFARSVGEPGEQTAVSPRRGGLFIDIYNRRWQRTTRIDAKGCAFAREDNTEGWFFSGRGDSSRARGMWDIGYAHVGTLGAKL